MLKVIPEFPNYLCFLLFFFISRKTNIEPLLQTDELTQQQAMQKAEEVHQFRQYRNRLHSIRDIEQEERFKVKDKVLEMYGEMRVSVQGHTRGSQLTDSFVILE